MRTVRKLANTGRITRVVPASSESGGLQERPNNMVPVPWLTMVLLPAIIQAFLKNRVTWHQRGHEPRIVIIWDTGFRHLDGWVGQPVLRQAAGSSPGPEEWQWPSDVPNSHGLPYLERASRCSMALCW